MPLEQNCRRFIGHHLFVVPYYGTGWYREDVKPSIWGWEDMIGPKSFSMLAGDFLEFNDRLIGIRGKIAESRHPYDGYWCLACLRSPDNYNFEDKPGDYMIWIARNEPQFLPAADKALYEYVIFDKSALCLCGYGTIAESPSRVQKYVEMAVSNRMSIEKEKNQLQ
jgi:hypothetical protein